MTTTVVTSQGWMVEVADWDKVRALVNDLFPATPAVTPAQASSAAADLQSEHARLAVYNGTMAEDLAKDTAVMLQQKGYEVLGYSNADRLDHDQTLIVVYRDKPLTVAALLRELGVSEEGIVQQPTAAEAADIAIILGQDYLERSSGQ